LKDLREDILPAFWEMDCVVEVKDGKILAKGGGKEIVILTEDELKRGRLVKILDERIQECKRQFKVIHRA
jgi:hypothetical protein